VECIITTQFSNLLPDPLNKNGELQLKNISGFKEYHMLLVLLLLSCAIFFAGCSGDTSSSAASTQAPLITPIGAPAVCLTINSPSLLKLADGNYKLGDEIVNCGAKAAGTLRVTLHIDTQTINLLGPATIPAKGKAMYSTFSSQTGKEIHFPSRSSSSALVTIFATINSSTQGEWDGEVTIPA